MSYTDDTVIIASYNIWSSAQDKITNYLRKVAKWLILNTLSLNVSKTVYIAYGSYCDSVRDSLQIEIGSNLIKRVESHKYLGILFYFNIKWDQRINYTVKKLSI